MRKVVFLLGAGFSVDAGLPMASEVSRMFASNPMKGQLLRFSSGEWAWSEGKSAIDKHNGGIMYREIYWMSAFLDESLQSFLKSNDLTKFNYENYLQYIIDLVWQSDHKFHEILGNISKLPESRWADDTDSRLANSEIISCLIHLVNDLLNRRKQSVQIVHKYKHYLDIICNPDYDVSIFSLNHDLVLESFFRDLEIPYSDGFTTQGSELRYGEHTLPIFKNDFSENIKLFKMHGSQHYYRYVYDQEANQHKGYDYFKTRNYHEYQGVLHFSDGEVVQAVNWNISPQFVTGTNKKRRILGDKMFKPLFDHFLTSMETANDLIISGYSFSDEHINEVLARCCNNLPRIVNINPNNFYPGPNVRNINPLTDDVSLL